MMRITMMQSRWMKMRPKSLRRIKGDPGRTEPKSRRPSPRGTIGGGQEAANEAQGPHPAIPAPPVRLANVSGDQAAVNLGGAGRVDLLISVKTLGSPPTVSRVSNAPTWHSVTGGSSILPPPCHRSDSPPLPRNL